MSPGSELSSENSKGHQEALKQRSWNTLAERSAQRHPASFDQPGMADRRYSKQPDEPHGADAFMDGRRDGPILRGA